MAQSNLGYWAEDGRRLARAGYWTPEYRAAMPEKDAEARYNLAIATGERERADAGVLEPFVNLGYGAAQGWYGGLRALGNTFDQAGLGNGLKDYADETLRQNQHWNVRSGANWLDKSMHTTGQAAASTAPGIALGFIPKVGTAASFAYFASLHLGDAVERNKKYGLSDEAAWAEAVPEALAVAGLENLGGTVAWGKRIAKTPGLKKAFANAATYAERRAIAKQILALSRRELGTKVADSMWKRLGVDILQNAGEEGAEEGFQYAVEALGGTLAQMAGKGDSFSKAWGDNFSMAEMWENVKGGLIGGAGLAPGMAGLDFAVNKVGRATQKYKLKSDIRNHIGLDNKFANQAAEDILNGVDQKEALGKAIIANIAERQKERMEDAAPGAESTSNAADPETMSTTDANALRNVWINHYADASEDSIRAEAYDLRISDAEKLPASELVKALVDHHVNADLRRIAEQYYSSGNPETGEAAPAPAAPATPQGAVNAAPTTQAAPPTVAAQVAPEAAESAPISDAAELPGGNGDFDPEALSNPATPGNAAGISVNPAASESGRFALTPEEKQDAAAVNFYNTQYGIDAAPVKLGDFAAAGYDNAGLPPTLGYANTVAGSLGAGRVVPVLTFADEETGRSTGADFSGMSSGDPRAMGRMLVNMEHNASPEQMLHSSLHEIVHNLIRNNEDAYKILVERILPLVYDQKALDERLKRYADNRQHTQAPANRDAALKEFICDLTADAMKTERFWKAAEKYNPSLARKLLSALVELLDKVRSILGYRHDHNLEVFGDNIEKVIDLAAQFVADPRSMLNTTTETETAQSEAEATEKHQKIRLSPSNAKMSEEEIQEYLAFHDQLNKEAEAEMEDAERSKTKRVTVPESRKVNTESVKEVSNAPKGIQWSEKTYKSEAFWNRAKVGVVGNDAYIRLQSQRLGARIFEIKNFRDKTITQIRQELNAASDGDAYPLGQNFDDALVSLHDQGMRVGSADQTMRPLAEAKSIAQRAAEKINAYINRFGTIINSDNAKLLFKGEGYDPHNPESVKKFHQKASDLVKNLFIILLTARKGKGNGTVVFTGGGNGSGKSSVLSGAEARNADFVFDSAMVNKEAARESIQRVLDNGQIPRLYFVFRDPAEAWFEGVKTRNESTDGHIVPEAVFANTHSKAKQNFIELVREFGDKVDYIIRDNSDGGREITLEELESKPNYTKEQILEAIHAESYTRARTILESAIGRGRTDSRTTDSGRSAEKTESGHSEARRPDAAATGTAGQVPGEVNSATVEKSSEDQTASARKTEADGQSTEETEETELRTDVLESADQITDEDFTHPTRNIQLPSLPEKTLALIGKKPKPVLLKKNILEKNRDNHKELSPEQSRAILNAALYHSELVGQSQPAKHPNYWVAVKLQNGGNAVVVLDVEDTKSGHEIVGWRMVNERGLQKLKNQAVREGGQILDTRNDSRSPSDQTGTSGSTDNITEAAEKSNPKNAVETKKSEKIEDYGEKIGGARKDKARADMEAALSENPTDAEILSLPSAKLYPAPNYAKLAEQGMSAESLALLRVVYDFLRPKKPGPSAMRWTSKKDVFLKSVRETRQLISDIIAGKLTLKDLGKEVTERDKRALELGKKIFELKTQQRKIADSIKIGISDDKEAQARSEYRRLDSELKKLYEGFSSYGHRWGDQTAAKRNELYHTAKAVMETGLNPAEMKLPYVIHSSVDSEGNFGYGIAGNYDYTEDFGEIAEKFAQRTREMNAAAAAAQAAGKKPFQLDRKKLRIYATSFARDSFYITYDGETVKGGFKTVEAVREYANSDTGIAEMTRILEERKQSETEAKQEYRHETSPRTGKDYRNGRDITPAELAATFGFRGVEFGNWADQKQRQNRLNETYDALLDLAELLGISPKAISLGGKLGIAFGSRGFGNFAAHFEPGNFAINLTKTRGAGSLAHEWLHALDNYFAKQSGHKLALATNLSLSALKAGGMRSELANKFYLLVKALQNSDMMRRSRKYGDYWRRIHEVAARAFSRYIVDRAAERGLNNDFLSSVMTEKDMSEAAQKLTPNATAEDMKTIGPAFDAFFNEVQEKTDEAGNTLLYSMPEDEAAENGAVRSGTEKYTDRDERLILNSEDPELSDMIPIRRAKNQEEAINALKTLPKEGVKNRETGIVAQINRTQRDKLVSGAALSKSQANGFAFVDHFLAVANIDRMFANASMVDDRKDNGGDKNVLSIKRFVAPCLINGNFAEAYITVKETVGSKLYSLELDEIKRPSDLKGSTLKERYYIPEGYHNLLQKIEKARAFLKKADISDTSDVTNALEKISHSIRQKFKSGNTSLHQVAAGFRKIDFAPDTVNLDLGGGKFDAGTRFLAEKGVTNLVFDPVNRDAAHNRRIFEAVKNGGVDTVTCNNVLNVIQEADARSNVILQAAKALKPGGTAYFTVYEGDGSGQGRQSQANAWQENRRTADYLEEVKQHFADVTLKNKVITARKPITEGKLSAWATDETFENPLTYSMSGDEDFGKDGVDYRRKIDPMFDFIMEYSDSGIVNPGLKHAGEDFHGSTFIPEAYRKPKPVKGALERQTVFLARMEKWQNTLANAPGTPLSELAAAYVQRFGGDEAAVAEKMLEKLRHLNRNTLRGERAADRREFAEHEREENARAAEEYKAELEKLTLGTDTPEERKAKADLDRMEQKDMADIAKQSPGLLRSIWNAFRKKDLNGKPDLNFLTKLIRDPMHIGERFPMIAKLRMAAIDAGDMKNRVLSFMTGEDFDKIKRLERQDKAAYKKVSDYLVQSDVDQTGAGNVKEEDGKFTAAAADGTILGQFDDEESAWTALFENERNLLTVRHGFSEDAADAVKAFRQTMRRQYLILRDGSLHQLRQLGVINADTEKYEIELPGEKEGETEKVDLFELYRDMGQRSGYYFPRIRHGRFLMFAQKSGANPVMIGFDTKANRALAAAKYSRMGYRVTYTVSNAPDPYFAKQVNPAALIDLFSNLSNRLKGQLDGNIKFADTTYTRKDGTKEPHFTVSGDIDRRLGNLLKGAGGRFYGDAWHFANADEKTRNQIRAMVAGYQKHHTAALTVQGVIGQTIVDMMRENTSRAHRIGRRDATGMDVVKGYEEDALTAMAHSLSGIAGGTARSAMANNMYHIIAGMDENIEDYIKKHLPELDRNAPDYRKKLEAAWLAAVNAYHQEAAEKAVDSARQPELARYVDNYVRNMLRNTSDLERVVGFWKSLAAIKYLFRISGAFNNLGGAITTVPAVLDHHTKCGIAFALGRMGEGYKLYGQFLYYNRFGKGRQLTGEAGAVMEIIHRNGWDGAELCKAATQAGLTFAAKGYRKFTDLALYAFGTVEQYNRAASIWSAYQALLRQKGIEASRLAPLEREKLVKEARNLSDFANGDYTKANKLFLAQGDSIGHLLFDMTAMFKTYGINLFNNIMDMILHGNWRRGGLKGTLYISTMLMLVAGIPASLVYTVLAQALGAAALPPPDDGEKREDQLFNWLADNGWDTTASFLRYGVNGLLGANTLGTYKSFAVATKEALENPKSALELGGAPASVVEDVWEAVKEYGHGRFLSGTEKLMPAAVGAPARAIREKTAGVTDRHGRIRKDVDDRAIEMDWNAFALRSLGFNPVSISEKTDRLRSEKIIEKTYAEKRKEIYDRYRYWYNSPGHDAAELADITKDIEAYNARVERSKRKFPKIDAKALKRAIK